ncbi:MAG: Manganese transport system membrane protein MntB [Chlamydiae bacterium]|nr:Manganese transport system membrane protein MntB [Chlamydiota bacterium]
MNPFLFFTDPVLRGPTWGAMLLGVVAALVGVSLLLRKRSLLGEALSHAAYPGVTISVVLAGFFSLERYLPFLILTGAFLSSLVGYWVLNWLKTTQRVSDDSSLCFILACFFGIGITIGSYVQFLYPHLYRQIQGFLYGQAATMHDAHILFYAALLLVVLVVYLLFYKEILVSLFDPSYAKSIGLGVRLVETILFLLSTFTVVVGIRTVGVVLMSALLMAPAIAARPFTHRLSLMLLIAGCVGMMSGFLGIYFSVLYSSSASYSLPSGPMIVLVAGGFALLSLLFAPGGGLFVRLYRIFRFRTQCLEENLLKALWHCGQNHEGGCSLPSLVEKQGLSPFSLRFLLHRLGKRGWIKAEDNRYQLNQEGMRRGGRIVRLHRLWEAYLVYSLGAKMDRVHKSAEEMEHILTPDLEKKLTTLLKDPKHDPHKQPIPSSGEVVESL